MRSINKIIWQLGIERGQTNENKFFLAFKENIGCLPEWLQSIERPTRAEDACGIDAIIQTTDVGKIFIQIKSSWSGVIRFNKKKRRQKIIPIIIEAGDSLELIQEKTLEAVRDYRTDLLKLRRQNFQNAK